MQTFGYAYDRQCRFEIFEILDNAAIAAAPTASCGRRIKFTAVEMHFHIPSWNFQRFFIVSYY